MPKDWATLGVQHRTSYKEAKPSMISYFCLVITALEHKSLPLHLAKKDKKKKKEYFCILKLLLNFHNTRGELESKEMEPFLLLLWQQEIRWHGFAFHQVTRNFLKHKKFHLNMRKSLTARVTEHQKSWPREVVKSAYLAIFKMQLHMSWATWSCWLCFEYFEQQSWTTRCSELPSNHTPFYNNFYFLISEINCKALLFRSLEERQLQFVHERLLELWMS